MTIREIKYILNTYFPEAKTRASKFGGVFFYTGVSSYYINPGDTILEVIDTLTIANEELKLRSN